MQRMSLWRLDLGMRNDGYCFRWFPGSASRRWSSEIYPLMWRDRIKAKVMQEQKLGVDNEPDISVHMTFGDQGRREVLIYHPILDQLPSRPLVG